MSYFMVLMQSHITGMDCLYLMILPIRIIVEKLFLPSTLFKWQNVIRFDKKIRFLLTRCETVSSEELVYGFVR